MYTVRLVHQFYEIIWSQRLTEEVCKQYRMTNREQPNEMQLDVYVRARMRIPVSMETVVCVSHSAQWESKWRLLIYYQRWCIDWLIDGAVRRIPGNVALPSCQSLGILPSFFSHWSRNISWMRAPRHTKWAGICWTDSHDCSEIAICMKIKALFMHSVILNEKWFFFLLLMNTFSCM